MNRSKNINIYSILFTINYYLVHLLPISCRKHQESERGKFLHSLLIIEHSSIEPEIECY